jgi:asparagine synthase (glutamine-hydrolysing)
MDSATVASLAYKHLGKPLECWFMAYKDQSDSPYDESKGVNDLIKATGWKLNRVDLTAPDLLAETEALMELTKAPMITVTWLAHFVLAKQARTAGNSFLFSGLGGDESLAGEFEHFFVFFADLKASGQDELLAKETEAWIRLHDHPVFKKSPAVRDDWFKRNIDFASGTILVDQRRYLAVQEYFDQAWWREMEAKEPPIPMPHPYPYYLSNRLFQEMNYETSTPTLWSEALSSKAAGIKGVFPMTSPKLLRLALSAPGTFKYQDGVTKMLLRRALKGILPESSRLNPVKTGFNAPLDEWLKEPKLLKDVHDLLVSPPFSNLNWLAKGATDRILTEHKSGARNHMMLLWPLISAAIFLRKFYA